jgi:hypothetical protein
MRRWLGWGAWAGLAGCGGIAVGPGDVGSSPGDGAASADVALEDSPSFDGTVLDALPGTDGASFDAGSGPRDATLDAPATDAPASDSPICPSPLAPCGHACVDLANDYANCGTCGHACTPGSVCSQGQCACDCGAGLTVCGSPCTCVDTRTDPNNCGACGALCPTGLLCTNGNCVVPCFVQLLGKQGAADDSPLYLVVCNGACIDPMTDPEHCGASGDCLGANAGVQCTSGLVCQNGVCEGLDASSE